MHLQYCVLQERNLQEMFPFPKISILELNLNTRGHVYGGVVLNLLSIWNGIQRLKLVIDRDMVILEYICLIYRIREIYLITFLDARIVVSYDVLVAMEN